MYHHGPDMVWQPETCTTKKAWLTTDLWLPKLQRTMIWRHPQGWGWRLAGGAKKVGNGCLKTLWKKVLQHLYTDANYYQRQYPCLLPRKKAASVVYYQILQSQSIHWIRAYKRFTLASAGVCLWRLERGSLVLPLYPPVCATPRETRPTVSLLNKSAMLLCILD